MTTADTTQYDEQHVRRLSDRLKNGIMAKCTDSV